MIDQDFIMLIMNCKKYAKKALFQKKTWLKSIPDYLKYYHVIGDETMEEDYKFDEESNILWIKVADDYISLPKKVIRAYQAIFDTFCFKFIFKTDDDQILIKPNFFDTTKNLITTMIPRPHYGGFVVDVKQPYLSQYDKIHPELPKELPLYQTKYCSGRFYFLSKSAVSNVINKSEKVEKEYLEDYAIGFNLDQIYKKDILNILTNNFFIDIELLDFPQWEKENKI